MIIDVTGFGWSGSGAVLDLLREYNDVYDPTPYKNGKPWEFTFLQCVDGIADLEWHLMTIHRRIFDSDIALNRFLALARKLCKHPLYRYESIFGGQFYRICEEYVEELTGMSFMSRTFYDRMQNPGKEIVRSVWNKSIDATVGKLQGKKRASQLYYRDFRSIRVSYEPNLFLEATQRFVTRLLNVLRKGEDRPLLMDHLLPPDVPNLFFKYFSEPIKCIVVRRDPRDLYVLAKEIYYGMIPIPTENVEDFIWFYRHTIERTKIDDTSNLLNLWFEDLIFNYEETKTIIEEFTDVHQHSIPKQLFKPELSRGNTCIFENYPSLRRDIDQIEKELPESLYPFRENRERNVSIDNIF